MLSEHGSQKHRVKLSCNHMISKHLHIPFKKISLSSIDLRYFYFLCIFKTILKTILGHEINSYIHIFFNQEDSLG